VVRQWLLGFGACRLWLGLFRLGLFRLGVLGWWCSGWRWVFAREAGAGAAASAAHGPGRAGRLRGPRRRWHAGRRGPR
jgi:hypothetical protein